MDFARANDAIFPRTEEKFLELARDRQLWCAISDADEYLGMSYANVDEDKNEVEIGGLMVHEAARGRGLGDFMMRVPLIHFLAMERPLHWDSPPTIVAHVLAGNPMPRNIIQRTGFAHHEEVCIPGHQLPGLRTDADGNVHGDEYHLKIPDAVMELADWIEGWDECMRDGSKAVIKMLEGDTRANWAAALRDLPTVQQAAEEGHGLATKEVSSPLS
jgi:GNAT superfamily N-acetyltransferase